LFVLICGLSFSSLRANSLSNFATTVSGTVTDETGESLIGVNILIKGTASGTVTDFDGNYTLDVPDGSNTLVFTYTGFQPQEINVDGRTTIDVVMTTDADILDE